jgi:predicted transcriptional regulator
MDFSHEELIETVERFVSGLLERAGVTSGPVDALAVAEHHLGIPIQWVEPDNDGDDGQARRRRPRDNGITLRTDMSEEQQQRAAAGGIANLLMPEMLRKLGVPLGAESKPLLATVRGLVVPRVLIPSKLLRAALRDCKYDVPALQAVFSTAGLEMTALRLLDLDAPCVIAVVDDGVVATRRGNRSPVSRKLERAEQECVDRVTELDLPHRARAGDWTAWGWPVPNRPFRRILLRAVPDEV